MDISVIVLTFNQEDTIERTLYSVINQVTDAKFEIIIGDDASSDNTELICRKFVAEYPDKIKYLRRSKNIGLVANYFDCFKISKGKYIADCSGDDYWSSPNKLQTQFEVLEKEHSVTLVSGEWICENTFTKATYHAKNEIKPGNYYGRKFLLDLFLNTKSVNLSASLYRKCVIEKVMKTKPALFLGANLKFEDLQIVMCCAMYGEIIVLPGTVFVYAIGHESVSHKNNSAKQFQYSLSTIQQIQEIQDFFLQQPSIQETKAISGFYKNKGDFICVHAFKAGPKAVEDLNITCFNNIEKGLKGKIYVSLMKKAIIWKYFLKLWKFLFPNKF